MCKFIIQVVLDNQDNEFISQVSENPQTFFLLTHVSGVVLNKKSTTAAQDTAYNQH